MSTKNLYIMYLINNVSVHLHLHKQLQEGKLPGQGGKITKQEEWVGGRKTGLQRNCNESESKHAPSQMVNGIRGVTELISIIYLI